MHTIKIRKGLNIPLKGEPEKTIENIKLPLTFAVKPPDFNGFNHKLLVKVGDKVLAGTPILHSKTNEKIVITSPVSGEVVEVVRGEKRVLLEVRIKSDEVIKYERFKENNQVPTDKDTIIDLLLRSGLWAFIRQRPYDIIPEPTAVPRDIYISTFDSSPLAPDYGFILKGKENFIQVAVDALSKLTIGKINFGLNAKAADNSLFERIKNVEHHYFSGPHPAGNVGVQIHHTKTISKGETVWYINIQDLVAIGKLMVEGIFDASRVIAITGPEASKPAYCQAIIGANISSFVHAKDSKLPLRYISGNVLTGDRIEHDGFLGYYHHQVTVIPEGDYYEFFGWAMPGLKKFSNTRQFFSKLIPSPSYKLDTNYHGSERAYVMTGQYEKVFPFDIYPVYLIKAILANDIDKMEELGIYEVSAEDFALCDFVCTSKIEVQEIVHNGLEMLRKEMS
ncbi:MAG: Na(+)-translocating NADH-quinone reductase subunit A [Bacteroidales bacterium]|nr:MAG: Na(+)-translocating NADH-quinone reductase subunit A [Bacteroidales bacterium]